MRRWPPASQGERPLEKPDLLTPWTSVLQNWEKIHFCCVGPPVWDFCCGSLGKLIHGVSQILGARQSQCMCQLPGCKKYHQRLHNLHVNSTSIEFIVVHRFYSLEVYVFEGRRDVKATSNMEKTQRTGSIWNSPFKKRTLTSFLVLYVFYFKVLEGFMLGFKYV